MEKHFSDMCTGGDMYVEIGRDWVLLSFQRFKIRVRTLLDITSLYWFPVDDPKKPAILFLSLVDRSGGG